MKKLQEEKAKKEAEEAERRKREAEEEAERKRQEEEEERQRLIRIELRKVNLVVLMLLTHFRNKRRSTWKRSA
jgi:hypothetical protein